MPCARFLEADWLTHGHVTRARDCHVVVMWLSRGLLLSRRAIKILKYVCLTILILVNLGRVSFQIFRYEQLIPRHFQFAQLPYLSYAIFDFSTSI